MKYFSLIFFFSFIGCNGQANNQKLKSITKTINDTILEKKEYDKNQNLIFEKHNQIDFGKENSIIFITAFEIDTMNNKVIKYYANSNTGLTKTISFTTRKTKSKNFHEIENRDNYRTNLFNINTKDDFIRYFNSVFPSNKTFENSKEYGDTINTVITKTFNNDTIIIETIVTQNSTFPLEYSKVYLNNRNQKLKEIVKGDYNKTIEYVYDEKERIISQNEKGQYYKFFYENDLLISKEMYHGNSLAFKDEFFYENGKLAKEVKHRITESKYFLKKPKIQTVLYHYEYY